MKKKQGRGFIWTDKDEEDLIKLYNTMAMKDLATHFGRTKESVKIKALKIGLKRDVAVRAYNRFWTEKEELYLKENYEFGDIEKIAKHLNRTKKAISERAKLLKITRDPEIVRKKSCKYKVNKQFFSQWSNNMAYVLGLICADGNLSRQKYGCRLSITLHKNDSSLIEDILMRMKSNHNIVYDRNTSVLSINNKHLYNDLLKLGITPNKSKTLKCPDVPNKFMPHFIRGVLDGDGSVDTKNKRIKIASASLDFTNGLSKMLKSLDIGHKVYNEPYTYNDTKTDFYIIKVLRKKDIKILYNLMYKHQQLYLKRKRQSFIDMGVKNKDFAIKCKSRWRAIVGTNIDTGIKIKFDSIKRACENGFCKAHLHKSLKNKSVQHKGYTWKYA